MKGWIQQLMVFVLFALSFQQAMLWGSRGVGAMGFSGLAATLTHPHTQHGFVQERTQEWAQRIEAGHQPKALFFGSSTVMNGVVPQVYDSLSSQSMDAQQNQSFSWASHSQSLREIPHLVKAALFECVPDVVYIGLSPHTWHYADKAAPETVLNWSTQSTLWKHSNWRKASWAMAWESASPHSLLLALHGTLWRPFNAPLPLPSKSAKARYVGAGHIENLDQIESFSPSNRSRAVFPEGWCEAVESIETICEVKGAEVVWLVMPTMDAIDFVLPDCLEDGNVIRGDLWSGQSEWKHFADPVHMNPAGARAFTTWLTHQQSTSFIH